MLERSLALAQTATVFCLQSFDRDNSGDIDRNEVPCFVRSDMHRTPAIIEPHY
jgi:hypothetical protein